MLALLVWLGLGAAVAGADGALETEHRRLLQAVRGDGEGTPYIVINTQQNELLLRRGGKVHQRALCATGSGRKLEGPKRRHNWTFDTPKGRFSVLRKVEDPLWIKPEWAFVEAGDDIPFLPEDRRRFQYGVLGEFALYFARDYMIHGTLYEINLGKSITHGCVRLGSDDLHYLYQQVEVGYPVYIY